MKPNSAASSLALLLATASLWAHAGHRQDSDPGEMRTRSIVLVDEAGEERARLGRVDSSSDSFGLVLGNYDIDASTGILELRGSATLLCASADGDSRMQFTDRKGQTRLLAAHNEESSLPYLAAYGEPGGPMAMMGVENELSPFVLMSDVRGRERLNLAVMSPPEDQGEGAVPHLSLKLPDGRDGARVGVGLSRGAESVNGLYVRSGQARGGMHEFIAPSVFTSRD